MSRELPKPLRWLLFVVLPLIALLFSLGCEEQGRHDDGWLQWHTEPVATTMTYADLTRDGHRLTILYIDDGRMLIQTDRPLEVKVLVSR